MKNNNQKFQIGFTLIELLIVIAIIGLLASVVMVQYPEAQKRARIAQAQQFASSLRGSLQADMVNYWPFDETSGNITKDLWIDEDHGTVYGAVWTDGVINGALEFDGANNDYVEIPNTPKFPLFTLSVWVYNVSGGNGRHSMLNHFWEIVGTRVCFWSYDFANDYWRCSTTNSVPYDEWIHIATVWDGSVISHYINGKLNWKDTNTSSGTSQSFSTIAGYSTRKFKGKLDELQIYQVNLPQAVIEQHYAEGLKEHNSLVSADF